MLKEFGGYLERLQALHEGIKQATTGIPQSALDWVPGSDMNSLCVLVVHTAGAERYWIGDVVGQDLSGRDRDSEFRPQGLSTAELFKRLDETLTHSLGVLETLKLQDVGSVCVSPRDDREFTVAWSLAHALEHTALHLGHMQIIRQLWDQEYSNE